jgi:uncharacterized membrane protein YqgA involved in biofilm formation
MRGRKVMMFVIGFVLTVLGVTVVLQQWENVVLVFKAVIGGLIAVIGLVIMFALSFKRHD